MIRLYINYVPFPIPTRIFLALKLIGGGVISSFFFASYGENCLNIFHK